MPGGGGLWLQRGRDRGIDAFLQQPLRDNIAIAAIIAGTAEQQSRLGGSDPPDHLRGPLPGPAHQFVDRRTAFDNSLFRLLHFSGGQDVAVVEHRGL